MANFASPGSFGRASTACAETIVHSVPMKLLLILTITLLSYTSALNGSFIWDDDHYVTENGTLTSIDGLERIWTEPHASPQYYPLVFTTFWVERHAWGLNPFGYHLVNVLLHAGVAGLLYLVLLRLEVPGAWPAALVFAVHPVNVETAAWISERKNLLAGLFYMLSAISLLRYYGIGRSASRTGGNRSLYYFAGLVLFGCALLSKTVTCTLPVVLLLVLWWKRGEVRWKEMLSLVLFLAVGAGMGLLTAWLERTHVGASGLEWDLSLSERFLVAGRALFFYVWKILWPVHLNFNYERWVVDGTVWWQYLYPLAVAVVLFLLWTVRWRIGRGPLVGALFFIVTLFPALGFFDVFPFRYSYVADHFQYLASIGPITLIVAGTCATILKYQHERLKLFAVAAVLVVSVLAVKTWSQGRVYADAWTLWNETLRDNPNSFLAHNNIGSILSKQGKHQEAMAHFAVALKLHQDSEMVHYNVGVELATQGRIDEAIAHYNEALRIRPDFEKPLNNLGSLLAQKGRIDEAVQLWTRAVEIRPDYVGAHANLLMAYMQIGDASAARWEYGRIKALDPALAEKIRHTFPGLE